MDNNISLNIPTRINPEAEPTFATLRDTELAKESLASQISEELSKTLKGHLGDPLSPEAVERIKRSLVARFPNCNLADVVVTHNDHKLSFIASEKDFADMLQAEYGENNESE
jgi:hypothetical protein